MVSFGFTKDEFSRFAAEIFIGSQKEARVVVDENMTRTSLELCDFIRIIDENSGSLIAEFERVKKAPSAQKIRWSKYDGSTNKS